MGPYPNIDRILDYLIEQSVPADLLLKLVRDMDGDLPMEQKEKKAAEIVDFIESTASERNDKI